MELPRSVRIRLCRREFGLGHIESRVSDGNEQVDLSLGGVAIDLCGFHLFLSGRSTQFREAAESSLGQTQGPARFNRARAKAYQIELASVDSLTCGRFQVLPRRHQSIRRRLST